ncbi:sensor histidine kinase [Phosphitispora fastidiosa]|uniref:sensor histidine kinase n=1 Tax=Phosphitispora fastidiosa TaxID=2837202 RepID=UPI001E379086|nr:ATP-binding protein [Phosphitispora fastidiosa]MBU7005406.1 two-component system sensor histidine kinase ResE [Phosphitispora fastidiosa]
MINRSLVGKLWLAILVLIILVMFFLGVFLSQFFGDFYFSLKSQELVRNGAEIADMIASAPDRQEWQEELTMISRYIDAKIVITDRRGLIRSCTIQGGGMHRGDKLMYPDVERILEGDIVTQRGEYPGLEMTVLSVGVPIKIKNQVIGAVFLHSPVEPVTDTVKTVQKFIMYGTVGTIILATILAFILSKKVTKPVLDMNRVALEMARGNFRERVIPESQDELGLLGNTLNFLSAELQKNIEALSTEKDQLESIIRSMTDAVVTFDINGSVLLINPPARELFKLRAETGTPHINDLSAIPMVAEMFQEALAEKKEMKGEIPFEEKTLKAVLAPLRNQDGNIRGIVAVLQDVTKEKRLEMLRREFVANVSHELRSPLSLLQGYVEALADGLAENEEERGQYLNILLDETLRLRRLVNDLLDLTQMETGNMTMRFDKISLSELIIRVTDRLRPLFAERGKEMTVAVPDKLPPVLGDEDRLQQVLVNLLDNAAKFTPEGGVVRVSAVTGHDRVDISVTDSGPGIPESELEQIWERFYKADKARTRDEAGGTGLGLAIVKNIIQAHRGSVSVTSEPERGTTFKVSLNIYDEGVSKKI